VVLAALVLIVEVFLKGVVVVLVDQEALVALVAVEHLILEHLVREEAQAQH
jgi:hypothetical protein